MIKKILLLSISLIFLSCDNSNADIICSENSNTFIFSLKNLNPNSNSYNEYIGPDTYPDSIRLFYFSNNEN